MVFCIAFKEANVLASYRHSELSEPAQLLACPSRVEVGKNPCDWDLKFSELLPSLPNMCVLLAGPVRPSLAGTVTFILSPPTCTNLVTGKVILTLGCFMFKKKASTVNTQIVSNYLQLSGHFFMYLLCRGLSKWQQAGLCLASKSSSHGIFLLSAAASRGKPKRCWKVPTVPTLLTALSLPRTSFLV